MLPTGGVASDIEAMEELSQIKGKKIGQMERERRGCRKRRRDRQCAYDPSTVLSGEEIQNWMGNEKKATREVDYNIQVPWGGSTCYLTMSLYIC